MSVTQSWFGAVAVKRRVEWPRFRGQVCYAAIATGWAWFLSYSIGLT